MVAAFLALLLTLHKPMRDSLAGRPNAAFAGTAYRMRWDRASSDRRWRSQNLRRERSLCASGRRGFPTYFPVVSLKEPLLKSLCRGFLYRFPRGSLGTIGAFSLRKSAA